MQILSHPLRPCISSVLGAGESPPLLHRLEIAHQLFPPVYNILLDEDDDEEGDVEIDNYDNVMEGDHHGGGIMESLEFDEHGIPTVFYLNVDNLDNHVNGMNGGTNNGMDDVGEDDEEIMGLSDNHHNVHLVTSDDEPFTHHYSLQEDGTIQYHHHNQSNSNGIDFSRFSDNMLDDDESPSDETEQNFEFEEITTMPLSDSHSGDLSSFQFRLQPSSSNSTSLTFPFTVVTSSSSSSPSQSLNIINAADYNNSNGRNNGTLVFRQQSQQPRLQFQSVSGAQKRKLPAQDPLLTTTTTTTPLSDSDQTEHHVPTISKRPKLVINLYEPELGYEFGCLLKDDVTSVQMSHMIPYEEDYLLRALDREEIPFKILHHLSPFLKWRRGHLLAQIRDYRRFSSGLRPQMAAQPIQKRNSISSRNNNNNSLATTGASRRSAPVVTELVLRPTTQSILSDFEDIVDTCTKKWQRSKSTQSGSEDEDDTGDEELEDSDYDIDLIEGGGGDPAEDDCNLTYEEKLELEKELINKTSGPLCLDPSPRVNLIQNKIQFERLKWRCPSLLPKQKLMLSSPPLVDDTDASSSPFLSFVQNMKEKSLANNNGNNLNGMSDRKEDTALTKLLPACSYQFPFMEYPLLQPPTSMEEINKLAPKPEPCIIRPLQIDNSVKKIEEYTLETERRKRPHTTKLSIFQRNGMDAYFGELEMESIQEGLPTTSKPGGGPVNKDNSLSTTSTKCQFELGSTQSVALYVKQFSDIFTEDGRRPCKITYQKVGHPNPQVLYTNSYNKTTTAPANGTNTTPTSTASSFITTPTSTTTSTPVLVATPQPQQPPVQIVHPQPRTIPPQQQQQQSVMDGGSSPSSTMISSSGQQLTQQILTRPPQQQQQPQLVQIQGKPLGPTNVPTASASHQQLLQQRLLRLKQQQQQQAQVQAQQQQQQQQPQTVLAKLLLTNTTTPMTTVPPTRPITVAVQPQPQKVMASPTTSTAVDQVNALNNQASHVSLNLNTMMLDGLLGHQQIGQNPQIIRSGSVGHHQAVNILRVNQNNQVVVSSSPTQLVTSSSSQSPGITGIQRHLPQQQQYTATATSTTTNLSSLLQQQHHNNSQQRILINNNGQQLTLSNQHHLPQYHTPSSSSASDGLDSSDLSVPDLSSLLASSAAPGTTHHHHHILSSPPTQHHHHQDTHNLNLNLNLNLNSGTLDSSSLNPQPPPFLVFISPLRSVPVSINATTTTTGNRPQQQTPSLLQQQLNAGPQPLSLDHHAGLVTSSSSSTGNELDHQSGGGELYATLDTGGVDQGGIIKLEPDLHRNTVMIGNTAYSLNVSSSSSLSSGASSTSGSGSGGGGGDKQDVITLSSLLGSSNKPSQQQPIQLTSTPTGLILPQPGGGGIVVSSSSSLLSSTPRLSALLAGTPSADSANNNSNIGGLGLMSPGAGNRGSSSGISLLSSGGGAAHLSPTKESVSSASSRTLLDRLAASLSSPKHNSTTSGVPVSPSASSTSPSIRSGLNPIASATPNVVLDHPVLAATLTGQQQQQASPKLVSAYRQIAPAPQAANSSSRGKLP